MEPGGRVWPNALQAPLGEAVPDPSPGFLAEANNVLKTRSLQSARAFVLPWQRVARVDEVIPN
jgi:hypothetical protein